METYKFPSQSEAGVVHTVTRTPSGELYCSCPGWRFARGGSRQCRHTKLVAAGKAPSKVIRRGADLDGTYAPKPTFKLLRHEFLAPMLAHPMPEAMTFKLNEWVIEEKFDGHRLIVSVREGHVKAWSRAQNERVLAPHVYAALAKFPNGTYDGELITLGKGHSYDVVRLDRQHRTLFMVFDVLRLLDRDVTKKPYLERRMYLQEIFDKRQFKTGVRLSECGYIHTAATVKAYVRAIWKRGGEGAVLKRAISPYVGKRSKDWLKIKALRSATLTLERLSKGKLGPCSIAHLVDAKGHRTSVKLRTLSLLRQVQSSPKAFLGRSVMIEYQERTPDQGYRHPRWDRFTDDM